jgi:alpha-L-rhamnosidase
MIKPPFDLRCEYLTNPIEIDIPNPCFSWLLEHEQKNQSLSAYQIIISSDELLSSKETGDIWDTGKVISQNSVNIDYNGTPLKSNNTYYWRVKWWDKTDSESSFSDIAYFGMAFLEEADWKAKWITRTEFLDKKTRRTLQYKSGGRDLFGILREVNAIYLRKEFKFEKSIKMAKLYICGLGYYVVRINGNRIGDRILDPAQTDYNKVALYSTYDITTHLHEKNSIGVILGNG